jgi:Type II restriction endonuclease EcoO109I
VKVAHGDLVIAVLYGEPGQESNHYKRLRDEFDYPLYVGKEFWHHLTGDENFYNDLRLAIVEVAAEANGAATLDKTIKKLAETNEIKKLVR